MSPGREKECSHGFSEPNLSSPNTSSSDDSTETPNLQNVLVTVRIQRPPKPTKNVKRVRFNSLVEVRFIPRVSKHDWRKYYCGRDFRDDRKKKYQPEDPENSLAMFKGEQEDFNQDVAIETVYKFNQVENEKDSSQDIENCACKNEENTRELRGILKGERTRNERLSTRDNTDSKHDEIEVNVTDKLGDDADDRDDLSEISIQVSYGNARQVFTPPKVVVGENYRGSYLKPAFPRLPPNSSRCRTCRTSKQWKQSFQDLNIMPVTHLCKQAPSLCKEADTFLSECDEHNGVQSRESAVNDVQTTTIQPLIPLQKPQENPLNLSDINFKSHRNCNSESSQIARLNANLSGLNESEKCVLNDPLRNDSCCRLYLPQLQRKGEDIHRLNEAILRRNPKYTKGITESKHCLWPRPPVALPKYGKFGKLNSRHSPQVKLSEPSQKPVSVLQFRYSTRNVQLVKGKQLSNIFE